MRFEYAPGAHVVIRPEHIDRAIQRLVWIEGLWPPPRSL
jgi:hypothetical protein